MIGMEEAIPETLSLPQKVIQSSSDSQLRLHYRYYLGTRVGDKWLCVVVKFGDDDAFVVTAYLTNRPKQRIVIWPESH